MLYIFEEFVKKYSIWLSDNKFKSTRRVLFPKEGLKIGISRLSAYSDSRRGLKEQTLSYPV